MSRLPRNHWLFKVAVRTNPELFSISLDFFGSGDLAALINVKFVVY
jgi:hypothetical protein